MVTLNTTVVLLLLPRLFFLLFRFIVIFPVILISRSVLQKLWVLILCRILGTLILAHPLQSFGKDGTFHFLPGLKISYIFQWEVTVFQYPVGILTFFSCF